MEINKNFWREKKVFITGHTGFKGAWLSMWLRLLGANVAGFALPPSTTPNLFSVLSLKEDISSVFGDIRDFDLVKNYIKKFDPEIIIHMAAQAIVRQSYQYPIDTFTVNAIGTAHVLEAARYTDSLKAIVCVTSDKCYDNKEWLWKYRETDSLGGWDPYSASKGCAEIIIASYRNSFFNRDNYEKHGVAVGSVRAGNVIGGGDWGQDRLIPDIMRAFSENERVVIRNPYSIRPWQYILDLLSGYLILAERLYEDGKNYMEAWNFGPNENEEITVRDMVQLICKMWGNDAQWELDKSNVDYPHEAFTLKLDSSKSRTRLGWAPKLSLDSSLKCVVEWYREFYSGVTSMREATEKQISNFERHSSI